MFSLKNSIFKIVLFSGILLVIFCSCKKDGNNYEKFLIGKWDVSSAIRNGKATHTLENAFFQFDQNGQVMFNLDGFPQQAKYVCKQDEVIISGSNMDTEYTLNINSDSTLVLKGNIRGYDFQFNLLKSRR